MTLLASRRSRLVLLLLVATGAITLLAWRAASSSLSYYVTPEEFAQQLDGDERRWRVGGRVVAGSVIEQNGRPVRFEIAGDAGERMTIHYDGVVPNLFGPGAFVVVDGTSAAPGSLDATSVIIKHENEFFEATPTPAASEAAPARN